MAPEPIKKRLEVKVDGKKIGNLCIKTNGEGTDVIVGKNIISSGYYSMNEERFVNMVIKRVRRDHSSESVEIRHY
tara:strand:+ start:368 stop:592 length:225 start_codon:yes stop_codon:yes gene_type:complete